MPGTILPGLPHLRLTELRKGGHTLQISKEEVIQNLRRQSRGHQQNSSQYRGVTLHQKGKWEARIGTLVGRKYK